jgi:dCTP deaminase
LLLGIKRLYLFGLRKRVLKKIFEDGYFMSILSNQQLIPILKALISPCNSDNLENASYELTLGNEYFATNNPEGVKILIKEGEQITIKPGQLALLITKEIVTIPTNIVAFISIKASIKFRGLVNVSGFHVDPGFHGRLKFSVYNAGSRDIILDEGQRLFPIWFCQLTDSLSEKEKYNGKFQNQMGITGEDINRVHGEILSPNVLNEKIKDLENTKIKVLEQSVTSLDTKRTIYLTIGASILLLVISIAVNTLLNNASIDLWKKQAQFESKIELLTTESNNQNKTIVEMQQKLDELERKGKEPSANASLKGQAKLGNNTQNE